MKFTTILILLICFVHCTKDPLQVRDDGVFLSREIVWSAETQDGTGFLPSDIPGANWIHNNIAFIVGTDNTVPTSKLLAIDISTGDRLWEWNDYFGDKGSVSVDANHFAVYDNRLAYLIGSRHHIIDINNGSTIWRDSSHLSIQRNDLESHDDKWFGQALTYTNNVTMEYIGQGSFTSPGVDTLIRPPHSLANSSQGSRNISSFEFVPGSGQTQMAVLYQNYTLEGGPRGQGKYVTYLGLYDLTRKEWIYKGVQISPDERSEVALYPAKAVGDYIYCAVGEFIGCYEIATGDKIWQRELPGEIWVSGFTIWENVCAVNCEDRNLYGLDAMTGNTLYEVPTAQLSSSLEGRVVNGVVYFVGGSDKSLFAIDLRPNTPKLLWKLDAERMSVEGTRFRKWLYVRQPRGDEPGKIMTQIGTKAICIDAHR